MQKTNPKKKLVSSLSQSRPGLESDMTPLPVFIDDRQSGKRLKAPGPVWTPLIPSTFDSEEVSTFGSDTPLKRPGQPVEIASAYLFLASEDASYVTGQFIHVNGGEIING